MPRRSRRGRSAPRPTARPVRNPPQPAQRVPPVAPVPASRGVSSIAQPQRAPPPAPAPASGGGSTIAQGVAFGIGSAVAHRLVDAIVGPRTIQHKTVVNEAAGASPASANNNVGDACGIHNKAFQDCLNNSGSENSRCQFYLDMLNECRKNSGSINA